MKLGGCTLLLLEDEPLLRRRIGAQLEKDGVEAELQQLIASQRELLRMVSHELRTPLQRMHFALERIRKAEDAAHRNDGLRRMERDLGELDALIDELLTYVRLQHDSPLPRHAVELSRLLDEVIEAQSELTDAVALRALPAPAELPKVMANARMLRRALGNLIENGLRNARSRVEVAVAYSGSPLRIDIAIDDDGPGVPAAERERIFAPFQRLPTGQQRGPAGCGLGLAIVRRIAEHHEGTITVDDSPLGGARFRFGGALRIQLERGTEAYVHAALLVVPDGPNEADSELKRHGSAPELARLWAESLPPVYRLRTPNPRWLRKFSQAGQPAREWSGLASSRAA